MAQGESFSPEVLRLWALEVELHPEPERQTLLLCLRTPLQVEEP